MKIRQIKLLYKFLNIILMIISFN